MAMGGLRHGGLPTTDEPVAGTDGPQTYIVHVNHPDPTKLSNPEDREAWYRSFLPVHPVDSGEPRLIYSYHKVVSGFAAWLTPRELQAMQKMEGFVDAFPDRLATTQTTHTPDYLQLHQPSGLWPQAGYGTGVIIAVLDTGILPNHTSFDATGMPPPPLKWNGRCDFSPPLCTNKIIGARTFLSGLQALLGETSLGGTNLPPFDDNGHGTHVAGTAAGRFVEGANFDGFAWGRAAGMAPDAHLAIYKVCGATGGCADSDILMGMDTAVSDGVDILSLSIQGPSRPLYSDTQAVGAFGAIDHGVFVSFAANNNGPSPGSISNDAPWILTVGSGTMDRSMVATVHLGNGHLVYGEPQYGPAFPSTLFPLVYPGGAGGSPQAAICSDLTGFKVSGKIVLCDSGGIPGPSKAAVVEGAGGVAMIIANTLAEGATKPFEKIPLPTSRVRFADGVKIKASVDSTGATARATLVFKGTTIGYPPAPVVAVDSGRGPSSQSRDILKPDVIGPEVNVLAAWPVPVGGSNDATHSFNLLSGTSMATPHLSGIVALLKATHKDWSPAAIKSAILTTATTVNTYGKPITDQADGNSATYFAVGAGQVDPPRANDAGLVYDLSPNDYIAYLCRINYTDAQVTVIARRTVICAHIPPIVPAGLNYPTFSVTLGPGGQLTVNRTVTNVGCATSSYSVRIDPPPGVAVTVFPPVLTFSSVKQPLPYTVTFVRLGGGRPSNWQGSLTWVSADGMTTVRSPIMATLV
uniref:Subtilisin-like protease n=1 Tax=Anthurium amnicola TaxID=1678845 RepID=A0A1D1Y0K3_9ARAE